MLITCDLSRNTIYWSNTFYKYEVQSWFSYSAVSVRTQTFCMLSFDILINVGFSFSYWSPYGCSMAAATPLVPYRYSSFQIKRKKQRQRPFPDLACPCFFFFSPRMGNSQQVFPLSLCLELVHMHILKLITGSREWDYCDWFRPILIHSFGLEKR